MAYMTFLKAPLGEYPHGLSNQSGELLPENGVVSAFLVHSYTVEP